MLLLIKIPFDTYFVNFVNTLLDKNNEVLRAAFLDETGTRICTCGSDGNAKIWLSDPSSEESVSTNASFTNVVTLPHGDTQIYACETLACVASEHVMTAAENLLHLWDLSEGGRDRPLKSLGFELYNNAKNSSGNLSIFFWCANVNYSHIDVCK